jgi:superfamily I DNA/RNA helicase
LTEWSGQNEINFNSLTIANAAFNLLTAKLNFKDNYSSFKEFVDDIYEKIIVQFEIRETIISQCEKQYEKQKSFFTHSTNSFQVFEEIEKNGKALSKFIETIFQIADIYDSINEGNSISFNDALEMIKSVTNLTKFQLEEKKNLGVNVTSIEQIRGINYRALILCGAVDGEFPLLFRTDKLLGKELPNSEKNHYDKEKLMFYNFITNNIKMLNDEKMNLYIFYPKFDKSKQLIRSSFIDDLWVITSKEQIEKYIQYADNCNSEST